MRDVYAVIHRYGIPVLKQSSAEANGRVQLGYVTAATREPDAGGAIHGV